MELNKNIILSHPRTGSTVMWHCFSNYYKKTNNLFIPTPGEIDSSTTFDANIFGELYKKINIDIIKIQNKDKDEMNKLYLKILNLDIFCIKYFPYTDDEYVQFKSIISKIKSRNITVNFLYRKNILEGTISKLISKYTNKYQSYEISKTGLKYDKIVFTEDQLKTLISEYILEINQCYKRFKILHSLNLVDHILTYEDNIQTGNFPYSGFNTKIFKMNSIENKNKILDNNPAIYKIILDSLNQNNMKVNSSYEILEEF